jgi:hypothetical protein
MAKACSGSNTVHYGYSMNWPCVVKGASVLDHLLPKEMNGQEDISYLNDWLKHSNVALTKFINMYGFVDLLLAPPIDDSRNIIDFSLYTLLRTKWLEAFFREAGMLDQKKQVMETDMPTYSSLSRTNSTVYFTFTYDPEITFFAAPGTIDPSNISEEDQRRMDSMARSFKS